MQNSKQDFAQKFLLEFTKQLIKNSEPQGIIELEQTESIPEPQEFKHLEEIDKVPKTRPKLIPKKPILKQENIPQQKISLKTITPQTGLQKPATKQPAKVLTIPEQKLPPRFQNIRPTPTKREIDLGKLNSIVEDPMANSIECDGADIPIRVITKTGQKRNTQITLTKEEIDTIINTFSTATRIPALEGVYKVAVGTLIFLAVVSEVVGSKFVIRKISPQSPGLRGPPGRPPQGHPMRRMPRRPMPPQRMIRK